MKKTARMLIGSCLRQSGLTARKRASFFYMFVVAFGFIAILFTASCARNAATSEQQALSAMREVSAEPGVGQEGSAIESLRPEIERAESENDLLKAQNNWFRSEVIRLNEALADANRTIYSLNRKLDAIFKPESEED